MTSLTDKPLILQWELWLGSLLGLKGLNSLRLFAALHYRYHYHYLYRYRCRCLFDYDTDNWSAECICQVAALNNDPLAWRGGLKARWAIAIYDAMEDIKMKLTEIEWPFLVLHGDADQLTMVEGSIMLEKNASSKDKTIKVSWLDNLFPWAWEI